MLSNASEMAQKMLQKSIAYFQELNLSLVQFDVSVLLWSASSRATNPLFSTIGRCNFKRLIGRRMESQPAAISTELSWLLVM
jgi:hypothetical protein